jgi:hypothetical protein
LQQLKRFREKFSQALGQASLDQLRANQTQQENVKPTGRRQGLQVAGLFVGAQVNRQGIEERV